jgi:hypothetical protein
MSVDLARSFLEENSDANRGLKRARAELQKVNGSLELRVRQCAVKLQIVNMHLETFSYPMPFLRRKHKPRLGTSTIIQPGKRI